MDKHYSHEGQHPDQEDFEIGKYEKVNLIQDMRKEREFLYKDLSKLKIYALVVIFLSALILVCTFL